MTRLLMLSFLACLYVPAMSLADDGKDNCGQQAKSRGLKGKARSEFMKSCTHARKHGHGKHERDEDNLSKAHPAPVQPVPNAPPAAAQTQAAQPAPQPQAQPAPQSVPQPQVAQPSPQPAPKPSVAQTQPSPKPAQRQVNTAVRQQRN
jgi:hypothetical protein